MAAVALPLLLLLLALLVPCCAAVAPAPAAMFTPLADSAGQHCRNEGAADG
eukprot:CAMPEP_0172903616 /NCGR_PEP_ID=MMETSP1075-20121228/170960_1 /TAXON_ID=2916 /ORGANISM="Ceratium fusus, Strain PA161109" /LENGTH=50 /DNA_ID=CAMNT_0013760485 /DNA_START=111 /DNA_END=259 /DNA_ORIENTATION=+